MRPSLVLFVGSTDAPEKTRVRQTALRLLDWLSDGTVVPFCRKQLTGFGS